MEVLKDVVGKWNGFAIQKLYGKEVVIPINCELSSKSGAASGTLTMDSSGLKFKNIAQTDSLKILIESVHTFESFIQFNYSNENDLEQFGSMTLQLVETGKKLEGWFAGYGPESQKVLVGMISLNKKSTSG